MNPLTRAHLSVAIILLAIMTAVIASLMFLSNARTDADRAAGDAATARHLADQIQSLRPAGLNQSGDAGSSSQLPRLIDDAMKTAEIETENLERISPQPARPNGQSRVSEMPLQLVFHQISLRQLLTFVTSLRSGHDWICLRDLHLAFPHQVLADGSTVEWNAELTISYLADSSPTAGISAAPVN